MIIFPIVILALSALDLVLPRQMRSFYASLYGLDPESPFLKLLMVIGPVFGFAVGIVFLVALLKAGP